MEATIIYGLILGSLIAGGLLAAWLQGERALRRHVEHLEAEARERELDRIRRHLLGNRN